MCIIVPLSVTQALQLLGKPGRRKRRFLKEFTELDLKSTSLFECCALLQNLTLWSCNQQQAL